MMRRGDEGFDYLRRRLDGLATRAEAVRRRAEGRGPDECDYVQRTVDALRAEESLCRKKLRDLRRTTKAPREEIWVHFSRAYAELESAVARAEAEL